MVGISIEGSTPEIQRAMRGEKADLDEVIEAARLVTKEPDVSLQLTTVVSGVNRDNLPALAGTVRDLAPDIWRLYQTGHTNTVRAVAVAPDGSWLASGSGDGAVRIWDAATGHVQTLMRADNDIRACSWLSSDAVVFGGAAGLYLFGFLPRISLPARQ